MRVAVAAPLAILISIGAAAPAAADDHSDKAVAYRQAIFKVMGWNIGALSQMAKGERPYDAAAAQQAANALAALGPIMPGAFDPATKSKRTLQAIWDEPAKFQSAVDQYLEASVALAAVAGNGRDAVGGALGALGASCKNCHDSFRGQR